MELFEYSVRRRRLPTEKRSKKERLGRILLLKNGFSIVFHKKSSWNILVRDADGNVIDRCKRNDSRAAIREKIKFYIEQAYPHYKDFNLSERFVETLIKPYRSIWMDFVEISKKALMPLCSESEAPQLFWDLGTHVFFFGDDLQFFAAKESGLCWLSRTEYSFDFDNYLQQHPDDWPWLHDHFDAEKLNLKPLEKEEDSFDLLTPDCGAFEIIFKLPKSVLKRWESQGSAQDKSEDRSTGLSADSTADAAQPPYGDSSLPAERRTRSQNQAPHPEKSLLTQKVVFPEPVKVKQALQA